MIVETAEIDLEMFGKLLEGMESKKTSINYAANQVKNAIRCITLKENK